MLVTSIKIFNKRKITYSNVYCEESKTKQTWLKVLNCKGDTNEYVEATTRKVTLTLEFKLGKHGYQC